MPPFADRLLRWYDANRRILPWRDRCDPWGTWVSEVMLQQTRVETVLDAYVRFMARYPTPADWALVSDDELLQAWRGLGYYRRARLLRTGAQQVVTHHGGEVPDDPDLLRTLAGIGDYSCGAIASIAFGHPLAALDGNVERVFARHARITTNIKQVATRRRLRELVLEQMDQRRAGDFNQALMDLGAEVCTAKKPSCDDCPVAGDCAARQAGVQSELPVLPKRRSLVDVFPHAVVVHRDDGRVLGARIPAGEINEGQIELPGTGILNDLNGGDDLAQQLRARYGVDLQIGAVIGEVRHGVTHHRIRLTVHHGILRGRARGGLKAFALDLPWTTASRKALSLAAKKSQQNQR